MRILVVDHICSFFPISKLIAATRGEHDIFTMTWATTQHSMDTIKRVNPDVVWCEWADANASVLSAQLPKLSRRIPLVVRLHGYESADEYLNRIDWTGVNRLVVVSPWFEQLLKKKLGTRAAVVMIPNGVDLDQFHIINDPIDDRRVAWLGYLNQKKGPALLRCVAASMRDRSFVVAGKFQCENTQRLLTDNPLPNLHLVGWVNSAEFLPGHRWILSTSVTESFSYAVAEGMACGLTPLVHAWPGADLLWPVECCWRTIDELKAIPPKDPHWCRQWIESRYSRPLQISRMVALMEELVAS